MSELVIRIGADERIRIEETENGITRIKFISLDELANCIYRSAEWKISSGLLPEGCIAYSEYENGDKCVTLLCQQERADISYYKTEYPAFPLPQLVFGFRVTAEGRIRSSRLGVTERNVRLKPSSQMYPYIISNVSKFNLCTGNNVMPQCASLHTLASVPHLILSMPNNDDYFRQEYNQKNMVLRELFEHLKDKTPEYYYSGILLPMEGVALKDFLEWQ